MRLYIVVRNRPWKTITVTSQHQEAVNAYEGAQKSDRRLMMVWDIINGIEIFQADLSYLKWTAMQPSPLGLSVLSPEDLHGLRAVLSDSLLLSIARGLEKDLPKAA